MSVRIYRLRRHARNTFLYFGVDAPLSRLRRRACVLTPRSRVKRQILWSTRASCFAFPRNLSGDPHSKWGCTCRGFCYRDCRNIEARGACMRIVHLRTRDRVAHNHVGGITWRYSIAVSRCTDAGRFGSFLSVYLEWRVIGIEEKRNITNSPYLSSFVLVMKRFSIRCLDR